jgi:hypothetical protein
VVGEGAHPSGAAWGARGGGAAHCFVAGLVWAPTGLLGVGAHPYAVLPTTDSRPCESAWWVQENCLVGV